MHAKQLSWVKKHRTDLSSVQHVSLYIYYEHVKVDILAFKKSLDLWYPTAKRMLSCTQNVYHLHLHLHYLLHSCK